MKRRLAFLVVVALIGALAMGGIALAHAHRGAAGAVPVGAAAGQGYHLDGGDWQVRGAAGGGAYHLALPGAVSGGGSPCCCLTLPCVLRNVP